jgi:hypothetical protein
VADYNGRPNRNLTKPDLAMRLFLLLLSTLLVLPAHAAFKKWVDENGAVHYGTSIPPEYVDRAHTELNQRGIEIKHVDRAKTAEELAQEQELKKLREKQQRLLQEQQTRDKLLLEMYRKDDDLMLERNGKLSQIDVHIMVKNKQIKTLKKRLAKWQAKAAAAERSGGKLNKKQQGALDATQRQIEAAYSSIIDKQRERQRLEDQYDRDLARLRQLRAIGQGQTVDTLELPPESRVIEVDGALTCIDLAQCDRLWPAAIAYAKRHASTPLQVQGPRIVMTKPATTPEEISTTVSRLHNKGRESLFLDVQCMDSVRGREFCKSERIQAIRQAFRPYLLKIDKE